jgi:hypothetical protein
MTPKHPSARTSGGVAAPLATKWTALDDHQLARFLASHENRCDEQSAGPMHKPHLQVSSRKKGTAEYGESDG